MTPFTPQDEDNRSEKRALEVFKALGYETLKGSELPRESTKQVLIQPTLRKQLKKLNPSFSDSQISKAISKLKKAQTDNVLKNNKAKHELLIN